MPHDLFKLIVFAVIVVLIWVAQYKYHYSKTNAFIRERGGRLLSFQWAPLAALMQQTRSFNVYRVTYCDIAGNEHVAFCKIDSWFGVHLFDDRIITQRDKSFDSDTHSWD